MANSSVLGCPTCLHSSQIRARLATARPVSTQRCSARRSSDQERPLDSVKVLLSGLAAAALLHAPAADAGVVLEKTQGKKFFQGGVAKPKPIPESTGKQGGGLPFSLPSVSLPSLPGLPSAPQLSPPSVSLSPPSGSIDPLALALPAAVAAIGGLGFLATKLDLGFSEFFREAIVKDSGGFAGYEETLKGPNEGLAGLSLPLNIPNPFEAAADAAQNGKKAVKSAKKGGTQALKPKKGSKSSKGGANPFAALLGKK